MALTLFICLLVWYEFTCYTGVFGWELTKTAWPGIHPRLLTLDAWARMHLSGRTPSKQAHIGTLSCLSKSGALILSVKANVDFMIVPAPLLFLDFSNEFDLIFYGN